MKKYILKNITFLFIIIIYGIDFNIYNKNKKGNMIFTFWEPKENIPGYLSLCIMTWEKFLPEYKIVILDYKTVKDYLGIKIFSSIINNNMSVMVQTDAIRVAILNKFGGIWMDADTIITNAGFIKSFKNLELAMINNKEGFQFIAFIYASKKSTIIKKWLDKIVNNVKTFENVLKNKKNTTEWINSWDKVNAWYYLGNELIDPLVKNVTGNQYYGINFNEMKVFPELEYFKNTSLNVYQTYDLFYFKPGDPQFAINNSKGLIFLHNSWTAQFYKNMTINQFLKQDILLSKLLKNLLNL